jgi:hypothetical protein
MLRVTIELVPYGKEEDKEKIVSLIIANDGTGTKELGNYKYWCEEKQDSLLWSNYKVWLAEAVGMPFLKMQGEIKSFDRKKSATALLLEVLKNVLKNP